MVHETLWGGHEGMWLCIRRPLGYVKLCGDAIAVCSCVRRPLRTWSFVGRPLGYIAVYEETIRVCGSV